LSIWDYLILDLRLVNLSQGIYTFLEYSVFSFILWNGISKKYFRKFILILSVLFILFQVINFIYTSKEASLDSIPVGVETILIFIFIFFFFYEHFNDTTTEYIYHNYCFWISMGILIYLGGSFFFNILISHLDKAEQHKYYYYTYIGEILKNVLFAIAIIMYARKSGTKISQHSSVPYLDMI